MATHFPRHFRPGSATPKPDLRWRHRELCFEHFAPPQHLGRAPKRLPAGLGSIQCYWCWWELFQYVPVYPILSWSILEPYSLFKIHEFGPQMEGTSSRGWAYWSIAVQGTCHRLIKGRLLSWGQESATENAQRLPTYEIAVSSSVVGLTLW